MQYAIVGIIILIVFMWKQPSAGASSGRVSTSGAVPPGAIANTSSVDPIKNLLNAFNNAFGLQPQPSRSSGGVSSGGGGGGGGITSGITRPSGDGGSSNEYSGGELNPDNFVRDSNGNPIVIGYDSEGNSVYAQIGVDESGLMLFDANGFPMASGPSLDYSSYDPTLADPFSNSPAVDGSPVVNNDQNAWQTVQDIQDVIDNYDWSNYYPTSDSSTWTNDGQTVDTSGVYGGYGGYGDDE